MPRRNNENIEADQIIHDQQTLDLRRAAEAQALLNNPLIRQAIDDMKKQIVAKWAMLDEPGQKKHREHLHKFYRVVTAFESSLLAHMQTGQFAMQSIEEQFAEQSRFQKLREQIGEFWKF